MPINPYQSPSSQDEVQQSKPDWQWTLSFACALLWSPMMFFIHQNFFILRNISKYGFDRSLFMFLSILLFHISFAIFITVEIRKGKRWARLLAVFYFSSINIVVLVSDFMLSKLNETAFGDVIFQIYYLRHPLPAVACLALLFCRPSTKWFDAYQTMVTSAPKA